MFFFPVPRSPRPFAPPQGNCGKCRQVDEAEIRICDVVVSMSRKSNLCVPAEFSAFIPRAEIRRRFQDGRLSEEEIILSSITIVHAPRHQTEKESKFVTTQTAVPPHSVRHWGDKGEWNGVKVDRPEKSVPRVSINGGVKPSGERSADEGEQGT